MFSLSKKDDEKWAAMNGQVAALVKEKKAADALSIARELFEWSRKAYGRKHRKTVNAANNLGFVLTINGKLDEAESCLLSALEMTEAVCGKLSMEAALLNANLSRLYKSKAEELMALNDTFARAKAGVGGSGCGRPHKTGADADVRATKEGSHVQD
ncbi:MAG: tetratricopeptide repeat protein [Nitrospiraceae bacterium]|nr:tetratricopeptide repeat protein [Nitrospiraceae bacterium]